MGLNFLNDGASWAEVTRDERFFCARLFMLIEENGVADFVDYLNSKMEFNLAPTANWEIAFEACFYRDLLHHRKNEGEPFSPKRTFDLCLFSDDAIVIIEAKSHGGFARKQMDEFDKDEKQVRELTKVKTVKLVALVSSKYQAKPETRKRFKGWLTWNDLAAQYSHDRTLQRADDIYDS